MFDRLTEDQEHKFWQAEAIHKRYGFEIESEPVVGQEQLWIEGLVKRAEEIEKAAETHRKIYGYKGNSKTLIKSLHGDRGLQKTLYWI